MSRVPCLVSHPFVKNISVCSERASSSISHVNWGVKESHCLSIGRLSFLKKKCKGVTDGGRHMARGGGGVEERGQPRLSQRRLSSICQKRLKVPAALGMSHVGGSGEGGRRLADYPAMSLLC